MTEQQKPPNMRLDLYENAGFSRGASRLKELAWITLSGVVFNSWLPGSGWRCSLLRAFGARIGRGVVIKSYVAVKFPWRLTVADHVWIGERVWIDNLAEVTIGAHSCISQGVYLCTGTHDWADPRFGLITRPIAIGSGCWLGAGSTLAPGSIVEDGAILAIKALGTGRLAQGQIYLNDGSIKQRPAVADAGSN
ncbi:MULTISPECIES: WcaF family extracellular polysaccharide biosynthesis acetyltransferase [Falsihalocynthiibacter]|uniref:WcaF family extracellular polysaccharide biosynthesis acetyltransferase n=1 Tax=Falsihalocynthiibacter TaxID=2854182 RepID=UPI003003163A